MKKYLLSATPLWQNAIILIRITSGYLIMQYGWDLFNEDTMKGYGQWAGDEGFSPPLAWAYIAKVTEVLGGALVIIGLFTRLASLALSINMAVITFKFHEGKFLSDDQLPFLLMVMFLYLLLAGPGKLSLDYFFFGRVKKPLIPSNQIGIVT